MKKIWANTIVNNEENFIWFAIMSVIDHIDKLLVWDTGSSDKTVEIIQEIRKIKKGKISFKEVGEVDRNKFTKIRQEMLEESVCDWILILDGDEIWWEDSIKKVTYEINQKGNRIDGIVVPMIVPVGDIFHIQEENAGNYQILGRKGHMNLRAINKLIPGLHVDWPYGRESYFDKDKKLVQERKRIVFVEAPYLHATHLRRSSKFKGMSEKFKYELGNPVPENFKFPEVFYKSYPHIIPPPWIKLPNKRLIKSYLLTPFRKLKRRILN